jgi:hypothetical protein
LGLAAGELKKNVIFLRYTIVVTISLRKPLGLLGFFVVFDNFETEKAWNFAKNPSSKAVFHQNGSYLGYLGPLTKQKWQFVGF